MPLLLLVLVIVLLLLSVFCTDWPWWWADRRKLRKSLTESGHRLVQMRGRLWARWDRVAAWTWVPVRVYAVIYVDQSGTGHQASGEFYLPWWLNKGFDSGFVGNFDLIDQRSTDSSLCEKSTKNAQETD